MLDTPRACISTGCPNLAPPTSNRCPSCSSAVERYKNQNRRARLAGGTGAADRLRRTVNAYGSAFCPQCRAWHRAPRIRVDHVTPLVDGGADVDGNVQTLCVDCHAAKTSAEARARRG